MKKLLNLEGVTILNKAQQGHINGSTGWCIPPLSTGCSSDSDCCGSSNGNYCLHQTCIPKYL